MEKPKKLTDEERANLCQRLDEDLERYMDELAEQSKAKNEKKEKEPFDLDALLEELDQHPFFMKELKPGKNGEYSHYVQALQALKYDDDAAQDALDDAMQAKKEGNKFFQLKKYRWANEQYTKGIKAFCQDKELNSQLYGNRAASNRHLGNLKTCAKDCIFAWKFNPRNLKAALRGVEVFLELGHAAKSLELATKIEETLEKLEKEEKLIDEEAMNKFKKDIGEIRKKAEARKVVEERDARRRAQEEKREAAEKKALCGMFKERGLRFRPPIDLDKPEELDWNDLCRKSPYTKELLQERVYIDKETDGLMWPVLLQYVGAGQTDMVKDSHEDLTFDRLLMPVFSEPAPWDRDEWNFRRDNVRLFLPLDVFDDEQLVEIHPEQTLREALSTKDHTIIQGLPVIQVYLKEKAEKELIKLENGHFRPR
ncbi:unnamed protein product [Bursaphelenchus xylophilus]|uniref:(pine wood nematode) hypothetical protein n=1 Tax=Bursaphelenchus xylophilus TaxID=6326 RepID=A0A1I7S0R8_BURXY|nr:unnamed protein product [Bursaphelenchus xylophilus]CAG9088313.1 unnamed protein product [Bursaphelenchus xylophilus]